MRNPILIYISFIFILTISCSTQKNTWTTRHYHSLNTRYNVYFNGNESFREGYKNLRKSFSEDYTRLLPVFLINKTGSEFNTARTIEKCEKAIKKHSIRTKPKKRPNSKSKESYRNFYKKEEFNPFMHNVFQLMAKARLYSGENEAAISTCKYINLHFKTEKDVCDRANIIMARAYMQEDWIYDTENILKKLNNEKLTKSETGNFSSVYADLLIREKDYNNAIPYLKIAIKKSHSKKEKRRWTFLLGQLYQICNQKENAYKAFGSIPKMSPPFEMEVYAKIRQTEVYPGNDPKKPLNKIRKMGRKRKYKDYKDQIFYAMGNLYMAKKDTAKAIKSYKKAIATVEAGTPQMLSIFLALGNIYLSQNDFINADSMFFKSATIIKKDDPRYDRIHEKSNSLHNLAPHLIIINYEDSLQRISMLPEEQINKIIKEKIKEAEKKQREERRKKEIEKTLEENGQQENKAPKMTLDINKNTNWYFYNATTVSNGIKLFRKTWGKRILTDNWRYGNIPNEEKEIDKKIIREDNDSTQNANLPETGTEEKSQDFSKNSDNPLEPNYYLKNIPFSAEQKEVSNKKIASAYLNAGIVFREQMENDPQAIACFDSLKNRFPESPDLEYALYLKYLILKQQKKEIEAEQTRLAEREKFPDGKYGIRLKDSLFIQHLKEMYQTEDSLFEKTFANYRQNKHDSVFAITKKVKEIYRLSPVFPNFLLVEALDYGKTGNPDEFYNNLKIIDTTYADCNIIGIVRSMLDLWDKGQRPVPSAGYESLFDKATANKELKNMQDSLKQLLSFDPKESQLLLMTYNDSTNVNHLLFDVALYNFTTFLIKDYEMAVETFQNKNALIISGFTDAKDVVRYNSWINFRKKQPEDKYPGIKRIIISTSNYNLLLRGLPLDDYLNFARDKYNNITF